MATSKLSKVIDIILGIIFIILLLEYFENGSKYFVVYIIFIVFNSLYVCWKNRQIINNLMTQIEIILYGKPLQKDFWEKGELKKYKKNRKFKWVMKSGSNENNKTDIKT